MNKAMKNSGIEWIGEVPENWQVSKCGNFFEIVLGKMLQPTRANSSDTFESYLSAINLGNNTLKYEPIKHMWFSESDKATLNINNGDLLVVEGGDVASSDIARNAPSGLHFQNSLMRVRVINTEHDIRFLRYWLMSAKSAGYVELICNKATIMHFPKNKLINFPYVYIESISEQKNIVDFLDYRCAKIDRLIALQEEMIAELHAYKQSVITKAVTKGLDPDVPMKDSGVDWIGEIPENWQSAKCGNFFEITLGKMLQPSSGSSLDSLEDYLSAINLGNNALKLEPIKKMWFSELEKELYKIKKGDLLIIEGGDVASSDIVHDISCDLFFQNSLMRVRAKSEEHDVRFLRYWLVSVKSSGYIELLCNKATIMHFPKNKLVNLPYVYVSSISEQREVADYIDDKCEKIEHMIFLRQSKIDTLKEYKKSLIYECVTGKRDCTMGRPKDGA